MAGHAGLKPHLQQLELILVTGLKVGTNSTTSQWFVPEQMKQHRLDRLRLLDCGGFVISFRVK
jgi:hypothetical protein